MALELCPHGSLVNFAALIIENRRSNGWRRDGSRDDMQGRYERDRKQNTNEVLLLTITVWCKKRTSGIASHKIADRFSGFPIAAFVGVRVDFVDKCAGVGRD